MDTTLQTFLLSFIKIGGKVLVIFMAVTKIGVAASSIVALLGSAGLALGLSLQGSLSNIAGGVILLLLKPFQVGDYIIEGNSGKEGTVQTGAIGCLCYVNVFVQLRIAKVKERLPYSCDSTWFNHG